MNDELKDLGDRLARAAGVPIEGLELDDAMIDALLDVARVAAHSTERKNAPLATFLCGVYVGLRSGSVAAPAALEDAVKHVEEAFGSAS